MPIDPISPGKTAFSRAIGADRGRNYPGARGSDAVSEQKNEKGLAATISAKIQVFKSAVSATRITLG
ncbi:MAG: hypothetical protein V2I27_11815 [Erythrobacter sp.]|nr:hypothetical protein [Erythrobacter sp.]